MAPETGDCNFLDNWIRSRGAGEHPLQGIPPPTTSTTTASHSLRHQQDLRRHQAQARAAAGRFLEGGVLSDDASLPASAAPEGERSSLELMSPMHDSVLSRSRQEGPLEACSRPSFDLDLDLAQAQHSQVHCFCAGFVAKSLLTGCCCGSRVLSDPCGSSSSKR